MTTEKGKRSPGFVLFDVLLALFLFSLGFGVLFGLTEKALAETRQAASLLEGANLAQEIMDRLASHSWSENIAEQACIPGETVEGYSGKFHWYIYSKWDDLPQLLRVSVKVCWVDQGHQSLYLLESLYDVE
jgi:Tfp pilus assembly protein PilV